MRDRADRAAVAAAQAQAGGRHERRPHLVEVTGGQAVPAGRATRSGRAAATRSARSRHAAPAGWATWAERFAAARLWWTEGTERAAARARERWQEQVATAQERRADGRATRQTGTGAGHPTPIRPAGSASRADRPAGPIPRHLAEAPRAQRAGWREDLVTGWCSALLVLGLYLDGGTRLDGRSGPILTPWHGVLYLGFVATAAWILTQDQRRGAWSLRAVPAGYRLGLAMLALAMLAGAGDVVWHAMVGAGHGLGRLVSPSQLALFAGACLLVSSPLRAAWSGPAPARVPGLRAFWPVLLSTTLLVAMTACFFQSVSPVVAVGPAGAPPAGTAQVYLLLGLLAHNLLFVAPVLLLLLRWQTPLGTFTVLAGSVAVALATRSGLGLVGLAGAAVLGGAAADVAVTLLRPSPQRRWAARAVAVIAPAVYWTSHFALLKAGYGVGGELELWLGSVIWASLSGFTLALLMWPPAVPLTAWNRGRGAGRSPAAAAPMPSSMPARMVGR
jgi:hypothetical protein